jgi:hypothetical protein
MLSMLKDQFGIDIARMMEAKTDAAIVDAQKKAADAAPAGPEKAGRN